MELIRSIIYFPTLCQNPLQWGAPYYVISEPENGTK